MKLEPCSVAGELEPRVGGLTEGDLHRPSTPLHLRGLGIGARIDIPNAHRRYLFPLQGATVGVVAVPGIGIAQIGCSREGLGEVLPGHQNLEVDAQQVHWYTGATEIDEQCIRKRSAADAVARVVQAKRRARDSYRLA